MDKAPYYIGLMSGTSLDGIDVVITTFPETACCIIATHCHPFPKDIQQTLKDLTTHPTCHLETLGALNIQLGELFTESIQATLKKANLKPSQIKAIGSHGQTIWHAPNHPHPFTWQMGAPFVIAQNTNITTIADFRGNDVACGGQGAPLTPPFHQWLLQNQTKDSIIANIGGIANITVIKKDAKDLLGYDTGPGNGLMDAWCQKHLNHPFDQNGQWALEGTSNQALLDKLFEHLFFQKPPPKSTGKEIFNLPWLEKQLTNKTYQPKDVQATLLNLTTKSITKAILSHTTKGTLYLCGGGAHNTALVKNLQQDLQNFTIKTTEDLGISPDWVEATCFAWLAKQRIEKSPLSLQTVTGSQKPTLLGAIYKA